MHKNITSTLVYIHCKRLEKIKLALLFFKCSKFNLHKNDHSGSAYPREKNILSFKVDKQNVKLTNFHTLCRLAESEQHFFICLEAEYLLLGLFDQIDQTKLSFCSNIESKSLN